MNALLIRVEEARELLKKTKGDIISIPCNRRDLQNISIALKLTDSYRDILDDELGLNDRRTKVKC